MIPSSSCRLSQRPDLAANPAQKNRSYTTPWGTIVEENLSIGQTHIEQ
jgi:hypothetical protein